MAIVLALVSALVYGVSDYCGGKATRAAPLLAVTLFTQLTTVTATAVVVAVTWEPFPGAADVAWSMAAGVMSITAVAAFYFALANGAMTVVAPITAVISAVVPVGAGVALGERPSALALAGVAVALLAVALVSGVVDPARQPTRALIIGLAVVAGVGFGLLFVFLDRTSDDSGFWPLVIGQATSLPIVGTAVVITGTAIRGIGRSGVLAIGAGLGAVLANVTYLLATRTGLLSLVAVITSMYPASTVGLATVLDHERPTRAQVVGLGLAVAALGMVSIGA